MDRSRENVLEKIYLAIDVLNGQYSLYIVKSPETPLFGANSELDSIVLVTLIVTVEERINFWFDTHITIADDRAMSCQHSPFRTIATLAEYVYKLIIEEP